MFQVHLATLNHGLQMVRFNVVGRRQRHQGFHHRVAGLTGKGFVDFTFPPGELGAGDARVDNLVYNVIDFAAKGVKRRDGCASLSGQEQKRVIKTAAGRGGFLLDILLGGHGPNCCTRNVAPTLFTPCNALTPRRASLAWRCAAAGGGRA